MASVNRSTPQSGNQGKKARGFFGRLGAVFTFLRTVVANVAIVLFLAMILVLVLSSPDQPEVHADTALLLQPAGALVEQRSQVDGITGLVSGPSTPETLVGDLVDALRTARDDDRITTLVINPTELAFASNAQLGAIGQAIDDFKTSGKPVIAFGEYFSQGQYFLASYADEVYMHPLGELMLTGFGAYQNYFQGLLDRLKVNVHVFRVGTYKAAVEPFTRSDMSAEAKQANQAMVDQLWGNYVEQVARNRQLKRESVDRYAAAFDEILTLANGDTARVALEHGLVDELLTPEELNQRLQQKVGEEDGGYRHINTAGYLAATREQSLPTGDQIGLVIASGNIMMGEQPSGSIGSTTLVNLIRRVRENDDIKALVLRVDSPGGSAFASELIRQELELVQTTGKPVVISMAGAAASGGYWIAATADEIWAAPTTITGSIGVFGILPTFESSLEYVGVGRDGVGTGPLSGAMDPMGGINARMANILQTSVEFSYKRFIELVSRGRDLEPAAVDAIAQGRVWTGQDALERGLIDRLGHLDEAIASAAAMVELDEYEITVIEPTPSAQELVFSQISDMLGLAELAPENPLAPLLNQLAAQGLLQDLNWLTNLNDPKNLYAVCAACGAARRF